MLTILTPAYNRANLLLKLLDSLKKQTDKNFCWLIIDDGSTDNTEDLCRQIISDNKLMDIVYQKKENGGKHTALNYSHKFLKDGILIIVDSDDYLTSDAVETINKDWLQYADIEIICGLSYLKGDINGNYIYDKFPNDYYVSNHVDYRINNKIIGDKAEVLRVDIFKKYPLPVFENEKFIGESLLWTKVGFEYQTVYINKTIYICEYLEGGLSKSGRALRVKCPQGGMAYAKLHLDKKIKLQIRFKMMILYICYAKFANQKLSDKRKEISNKCLFNICLPLGLFFYFKWKKLLV